MQSAAFARAAAASPPSQPPPPAGLLLGRVSAALVAVLTPANVNAKPAPESVHWHRRDLGCATARVAGMPDWAIRTVRGWYRDSQYRTRQPSWWATEIRDLAARVQP